MRIDLHTHSSVSDGSDRPAELISAAAAAGLAAVALTDHDTFAGLAEAAAAADRLGIRLVPGIELSAEHAAASVHVLGYGCRADDPDLTAELAKVRQGRAQRVPEMLARLAAAGMPVPDAVLARWVGDSPSVGRPHLADAMVELGYVPDRRAAFDAWLADDRPIFVPRYATSLPLALRLIQAAGGAAVIAHPWGRSGREQLPADVLAELAGDGLLDGLEVDHPDHDQATRRALRELTARSGIVATGSSDYHGTGKTGHDLGCNLTPVPVLAQLAERAAGRGGRL